MSTPRLSLLPNPHPKGKPLAQSAKGGMMDAAAAAAAAEEAERAKLKEARKERKKEKKVN